MAIPAFDPQRVTAAWKAFAAEVPIRPIRNDADYDQMVAVMNQLLDLVGDDAAHPLRTLLTLVGDQVERYDNHLLKLRNPEPREVLRYLMDQHNLKQSDLQDLIAQPNLSAILNGRRAISRDVAKALAQRFNVAVDAFL